MLVAARAAALVVITAHFGIFLGESAFAHGAFLEEDTLGVSDDIQLRGGGAHQYPSLEEMGEAIGGLFYDLLDSVALEGQLTKQGKMPKSRRLGQPNLFSDTSFNDTSSFNSSAAFRRYLQATNQGPDSLTLSTKTDPCSVDHGIKRMTDVLSSLIPDEMAISTRADQLIYMMPCDGLPLARKRSDGSVPLFGYVAAYNYMFDIMFGVINAVDAMVDFTRCLVGDGDNVDGNPFEQGVLQVQDYFQNPMLSNNPMRKYIERPWVDPSNCADHKSGNTATACSKTKPCCSYDIAGQNAEFHPICDNGVCKDFTQSTTPSCYKEGYAQCTKNGECCQQQNQLVTCQKANENDATGTCKKAPNQPVGWNPFCLAYSQKSFALNFGYPFPPLKLDPTGGLILGTLLPNRVGRFPGFPPPGPLPLCQFVNGFAPAAPTSDFVPTLQIKGLGVGWGEDLSYGTNKATRGSSAARVWDGFLSRPLPENPGTNFWLATRIQALPREGHITAVSGCLAGGQIPLPPLAAYTPIAFYMDTELYVDAGTSGTSGECIIMAMTGAVIKLSQWEVVLGRGLGGWCKAPDDCSPNGFFINIEPTFNIKLFGHSMLATIFTGLGTADMHTDPTVPTPQGKYSLDGGLSFGVFTSRSNGEPVAVVLRAEMPQLKIFGIQVTPSSQVHIQYFRGSELNRRIKSILRIDGVSSCPSLTGPGKCNTWKPYERIVNGVNVYGTKTVEICVDRITELDHYNRLMVASIVRGKAELPKRVKSSNVGQIQKWYNNEKFDQWYNPTAHNMVIYVAMGGWPNPIVMLTEISILFIMQVEAGVLNTNVSPGMTNAQVEAAINEMKAPPKDEKVDVYAELYLKVQVGFLVDIEAAASLQNNVDGAGSYDKWVVSAAFSVELGPLGCVGVSIQSSPFSFNARRRRLMGGNETEYHEMSRQLAQAQPQYTVDMDFGCLDIGQLIKEGLTVAWNTLVAKPIQFIGEKLVAIGQFLKEEFKDTLFDPSVWNDLKAMADQMAANRQDNMDSLAEAIEAKDWEKTYHTALKFIDDEIQAHVALINSLAQTAVATATSIVNTINEANAGLKKFALDASNGWIKFTCEATDCYHNNPHNSIEKLSDTRLDSVGCTETKYKSTSCCGCKNNDWCNFWGCSGRCADRSSYYWQSDAACAQRKAEEAAAAARAAAAAEKARKEAEKKKLENVRKKVDEVNGYLKVHMHNKQYETRGLHAAMKDPTILGTPKLEIGKVRIAANGSTKTSVPIQAKATGLPHLQAADASPTFADENLFKNGEVVNMDFYMKPGENSETAKTRILNEIKAATKEQAVQAALGSTQLTGTKLSKLQGIKHIGHGPSGYQYWSKEQAYNACAAEGMQLCPKKKVMGFHKCAAGWMADFKGYYMETRHPSGHCGGAGMNWWGHASAGAFCCTIVPEMVKQGQLTTERQAGNECMAVGKRLCHRDELAGYQLCAAGFVQGGSKSWWMSKGGCGAEGLNTNNGIATVGAYCCEADDAFYFPNGASPYIYWSKKAAADACAVGGFQLCTKKKVMGHSRCAAAYMADFRGYYMDHVHPSGYCGGAGMNWWGHGGAGAQCCPREPEYVRKTVANVQQARNSCQETGKQLCFKEQVVGYDYCASGFISDGTKSWWMSHTKTHCGSEGWNTWPHAGTAAGSYCCENRGPYYIDGGARYPYGSRKAASDACQGQGLQLCTDDEITGFELCKAGYTADGRGYWMDTVVNGCGGVGYNNWGHQYAGAYCCDTKPEHIATSVGNLDAASTACHNIGKGLCAPSDLVGFEKCAGGYVSDGRSAWWMAHYHSSGHCAQEGLNFWGENAQTGVYCCQNKPYYLPGGYQFTTKAAAETACNTVGLTLCSKAEIVGTPRCAWGWLSDDAGLWMDRVHPSGHCGGDGFNRHGGGGAAIGAYCCKK